MSEPSADPPDNYSPLKLPDIPSDTSLSEDSSSDGSFYVGEEIHGVKVNPVPDPLPNGQIRPFIIRVVQEFIFKEQGLFPYWFRHMYPNQREYKYIWDRMNEYNRSHVPTAWPRFKIPKAKAPKKQPDEKKRVVKRKSNKIGPMDAFTKNPKFPRAAKPKGSKKEKQPSKAVQEKERIKAMEDSFRHNFEEERKALNEPGSPICYYWRGYKIGKSTDDDVKENTDTPDKKPAAK